MNMPISLFILQAIWIKAVRGAQQFEIKPTDVEVNPGEGATLTCKIYNRHGNCSWAKDGIVFEISTREPDTGDCSLRIPSAKIEKDDGMYQCHVLQMGLSEPKLTAFEVKFTVREPPMPPRIESNRSNETYVFSPGERYFALAGKLERLRCISRKGNPPAKLRWFIEDTDITTMSNQTNTTDPNKAKTWQAISVLDYVFQKDHNGKMLKCVAYHAAYETLTKEIKLLLEVVYPPDIHLKGQPVKDIEEGERISVKCVADANPKAYITWRRSGYSGIYTRLEKIEFMPVKRSDSGIFICSASNDVGVSQELEVNIDVKFQPQIIKVSPYPGDKVTVYHNTTFVCEAKGNPPPKYSWLQKMGEDPISWQQRGNSAVLHILNATYQYQGQYVCEASNTINGHPYKLTSSEITLDVIGGFAASPCPPPDVPFGGTYSPQEKSYLPGDRVTFSCEEAFTRIGSESISCGPYGRWLGSMPLCEIFCDLSYGNSSGFVWHLEGKIPSVGSRRVLHCLEPYFILSGQPASVTCQKDGTWTPTDAKCVRNEVVPFCRKWLP